MAATDCPTPAELLAYIPEAVGSTAGGALAAHVRGCTGCQQFLNRQQATSPPLDATPPPVSNEQPTTSSSNPPSSPIGYELVDEIGEGGMGVVFRARDVRLSRDVAIKLVQERYAEHPDVRHRFLSEARITGQLQHPGIPAVHELGSLPDGRPFLAMKLVKGHTLAALLAAGRESSTKDDRGRFIAIFEHVCQAVGYAHSRNVIHRDLKPANVMVGAFGEVQVMDWGLAKVVDDDEPAVTSSESAELAKTFVPATAIETPPSTSPTQAGSVLGTPAYMPPEQAGGEIDKLSARSDVFALGAILCQILTGCPPYRGSVQEVQLQAVRGDTGKALAALDQCAADAELVALCKRCLAFHQAARPADAAAVAHSVAGIRQAAETRARDAERERAAAVVREAEQARGRRVLIAAGGMVMAVLLTGIVGTTWGLLEARRQQGIADGERHDAQVARDEARRRADSEKLARMQAQKRLKQIERGNNILVNIFADLDMQQVKRGNEPLEAVLAKRLVKAATQLDEESVGDPLTVADLQNRLGLTLLRLGYPAAALPLFKKARGTWSAEYGPRHQNTLTAVNNLAGAYRDAGQFDKALPLLEDSLREKQATLGPGHASTLLAMNNLASTCMAASELKKAVALFEEVVRLNKLHRGAEHRDTLTSMNNLATTYRQLGQLQKAQQLLDEVVRLQSQTLGTDHPATLTAFGNRAEAKGAAGDAVTSLPRLEEAWQKKQSRLGTDHPDTLAALNNLAHACQRAGKLGRAVQLFEDAHRLSKSRLGDEHPLTLTSESNLGMAHLQNGNYKKALPLVEKALRLKQSILGRDHISTVVSMFNLATAYREAGRPKEALPLFEQSLKLIRRTLSTDHPYAVIAIIDLAEAYRVAGQTERSIPLLEEAVQLRKRQLGPSHPETLTAMNNLAVDYQRAGQTNKSVTLFEETLRLKRTALGTDHPDVLATMNNLATVYCHANRGGDAIPLFAEYFKHRLKEPPDSRLANALDHASLLLLNCRQFAEAERYLRKSLTVREQMQPEDWTTFRNRAVLGWALTAQKKYDEAEPLLLTGYRGMQEREQTIPAKLKIELSNALRFLVAHFTRRRKTAEAAHWQKELDQRNQK